MSTIPKMRMETTVDKVRLKQTYKQTGVVMALSAITTPVCLYVCYMFVLWVRRLLRRKRT